MSLYNMLRGYNVNAGLCCAMLDIDPNNISRFRDAWLSDDGSEIVILTRTGGGNREAYEESNTQMHDIPGFISDEDDDFDSTFAKFTYTTPDEFKVHTATIAKVMKLAGMGSENQGPEALVAAFEPNQVKPKQEITEDDPRLDEAEKAFEEIKKTLLERYNKTP